ncbi:hypothetical protein BGW36DRAFT_389785 [Talaromyces proteolyticus]|uniref:Uncharacterized protein n=1 Tax=Talaromyces proteolyticus TaxID=1131652 RepID=A0AAD4KFA8_9EURO|nr:uncharacterized protein BGW36DRAFT_389785 [Talaromyces proteolyticus]KAH8689813.1 hypothetical protein BGW36DRAFT_389785 [Talaromyces proteolyticus]
MDDIEGPNFTIDDAGGRAKVEQYIHISKFRTGDTVYLHFSGTAAPEGPYIIASVPSAGKYTLCLPDGQTVRNGEAVEEQYLQGTQCCAA